MNEYARFKKHLEHSRPTWQCCECKAHFPAQDFGARPKNSEEARTLCIAAGYWRKRGACAAALKQSNSQLPTIHPCATCRKDRLAVFFDYGATQCSSCASLESFKVEVCSECNRLQPASKFVLKGIKSNEYICSQCNPHKENMYCDVCWQHLPAASFTTSQRKKVTHFCAAESVSLAQYATREKQRTISMMQVKNAGCVQAADSIVISAAKTCRNQLIHHRNCIT